MGYTLSLKDVENSFESKCLILANENKNKKHTTLNLLYGGILAYTLINSNFE